MRRTTRTVEVDFGDVRKELQITVLVSKQINYNTKKNKDMKDIIDVTQALTNLISTLKYLGESKVLTHEEQNLRSDLLIKTIDKINCQLDLLV